MLTLSAIYIYPVKSLGGISVDSAYADKQGLKYDRRYLLVDETRMFITQRDFPQLALLKLSIIENGFKVLNNLDSSQTVIPFESDSKENLSVKIWDDVCNAVMVSKDLNNWFSSAINKKCYLVYMPDDEKRLVEKKYINEEHIVSFADAYPFLIIGQASLEDLNSRLQRPVPMNRFRTNFVFTGGNPYEEDNWKDFKISDTKFKAVKPCARCVITTTDQDTAEPSVEPLKTLSDYRKINNKVMFGMNVVCNKPGLVSINQKIELF